jgi:hypothetical protein
MAGMERTEGEVEDEREMGYRACKALPLYIISIRNIV